MANHVLYDEFYDIDDLEELPPIRNAPRSKSPETHPRQANHKPKRPMAEILAQVADQSDGQEGFDFSYHASRHERQWILDSLGHFYEQQWLEDVLRLLKGGKEANVYQCLTNSTVAGLDQPYIAAKVYRPRRFRNLKNDHLYSEGRDRLDAEGRRINDDGMNHAMDKRTTYGLELLHASWIEHEFQTMQVLHAAGADVPTPYASGNNAILMGYIGGDEIPAPTLNTVELDRDEAKHLFARVLHNIEVMLANNRVHADLSAYNILYWEGKITLIDFPQVIDPNVNRSAFKIFERDVTRVCEYFTLQGVKLNPHRLAADLWTAHGFRMSPEIHPALLDAEDEKDRAYWRKMTSR